MTCHPTDPTNPPDANGRQASPGTITRECAGSVLLIAREIRQATDILKGGGTVSEYQQSSRLGLTRRGLEFWAWRFAMGGTFLTGPSLPLDFFDDPQIQKPD